MSHTSTIRARNPWNDTGFDFEAGCACRFDYEIDPDEPWKDFYQNCDPVLGHNALLARPLKRLCRLPGRNYFVLAGCIGRDLATVFAVLDYREIDFLPARGGRLWVFANDVPGFYFNNFGKLRLTIHPQS